MLKLKIYVCVLMIILSSCATKQSPVVIEKGNKNNIITDKSLPITSGILENPYESYITNNNTMGNCPCAYQSSDQNIYTNTHTVVYGDTVYNISKRYSISQDDLIAWNKIINNSISIGQILFIKDPSLSNIDKSISNNVPKNVNNSNYNIFNNLNPNESKQNLVKTKNYEGIVWTNPSNGYVINQYNLQNKGIDFGGDIGSPIFAAADGKVVYSGSGLKGYGNLIIIQHNPIYLTAYANNKSLLLKEGDRVSRGQKIATMGDSDSPNVKLHFEVRKNGQPVNPINFIPF